MKKIVLFLIVTGLASMSMGGCTSLNYTSSEGAIIEYRSWGKREVKDLEITVDKRGNKTFSLGDTKNENVMSGAFKDLTETVKNLSGT